MKNYIRVVLGSKSIYADICKEQNFIGADYGIHQDLTNELPENWKDFNAKFRDIYLTNFPEKSKIAAGLACGMLWTICKGFNIGDVILSPNGKGSYLVGEVSSDYYYHPAAFDHQDDTPCDGCQTGFYCSRQHRIAGSRNRGRDRCCRIDRLPDHRHSQCPSGTIHRHRQDWCSSTRYRCGISP